MWFLHPLPFPLASSTWLHFVVLSFYIFFFLPFPSCALVLFWCWFFLLVRLLTSYLVVWLRSLTSAINLVNLVPVTSDRPFYYDPVCYHQYHLPCLFLTCVVLLVIESALSSHHFRCACSFPCTGHDGLRLSVLQDGVSVSYSATHFEFFSYRRCSVFERSSFVRDSALSYILVVVQVIFRRVSFAGLYLTWAP
ncbi:hypothetical protein BV22DRAFT_755373 [Leucogyrophana mollusca]|uniref:Uncharacterized protein n=1 Tax=Leucogyrophana mollusca TaxID=85980 RepID=A0ACB8B5M9_9AGAM|nr:hypothetical protein BV22DRAFT_755373 [Leucogyrophana mollusca]